MSKASILLAAIAVLAGAGQARAQEPEQKPDLRNLWSREAYAELVAGRMQAAALAVVPESEPNNDAASADAVALGDQGTGSIDGAGDIDWWSFAVNGGTIVDIEVDAYEGGSALHPVLALFDSDGTTLLAENDDFDGLDSRIQYSISTTGTYYIAIIDFGGTGSASHTYTINFNTTQTPPGDPTTEIASDMSGPFGMATGANGDFYVMEGGTGSILRITSAGTKSAFASASNGWGSPAFDAFGNLLVPSDNGIVSKVTPSGTVTSFITDAAFPFWIAIGPDGKIWISDIDDGEIRYYEPDGAYLGSIDLTSVGGVGPIGFSPDGVLHFSNGPDLYRFVGSPQAIVTDQPVMWGLSFDTDGNIYVSNPEQAKLVVYGPTGTTVADPFSVSVGFSLANAFGRNSDGSWNGRLFATDISAGTLVEFNASGVLATGAPVGFLIDMISTDAAADELLGDSGSLSEAEMDFLDWLGNGNGGYDVGDFRALLVERGTVATSLSPAVQALLKAADPAGNSR